MCLSGVILLGIVVPVRRMQRVSFAMPVLLPATMKDMKCTFIVRHRVDVVIVGDVEAWAVDGCCPSHCPPREDIPTDSYSLQDLQEAVRISFKGQQDGVDAVSQTLPKPLAAALGVVIGAAVECLVQAVDGAGIGADPVQWKLRWADEACPVDV